MRGWSDYFFLVGSAAAALIGLMFVVVTLTAGRDRNELEAGKKLYTTPIVWHLSMVMVISGAAVAANIPLHWLGAGVLFAGVIGSAYGGFVARGILQAQLASNFTGYDAFWYGFAPTLIYVALAVSGWAIMRDAAWGPGAIAAGAMALLLVSIHNEWDLVTYLAPDASGGAAGTSGPTGP